jgi:hypothetical protein
MNLLIVYHLLSIAEKRIEVRKYSLILFDKILNKFFYSINVFVIIVRKKNKGQRKNCHN